MKELSIEQKAERYDETIKKVNDYYEGKIKLYSNLDKTLEYLFPELKESEDEKMRKGIIKFLIDVNNGAYTKSELEIASWIAWLEKQGENNMGISEATKQKLEDNLNKALEKETPESWNEFLEKQGEQKAVDKIKPKFKVGDEIKTVNEKPLIITKIDDKGYWSEDLFICDFDNDTKWWLIGQKSYNTIEINSHIKH